MKKLFLFFTIVLIPFGTKAQDLYKQPLPVNQTTGKIEFQQVLEASGKSKEDVYNAARQWFVHAFVSANAVLQMEDKETGLLIGKGRLGDAEFIVKIESKEGRARYTLTDISYSYPTLRKVYPAEEILSDKNLYKANGQSRSIQRNLKESLLTANNSFLTSLQQALTTPATATDW
jgi:hypothetical protein